MPFFSRLYTKLYINMNETFTNFSYLSKRQHQITGLLDRYQ